MAEVNGGPSFAAISQTNPYHETQSATEVVRPRFAPGAPPPPPPGPRDGRDLADGDGMDPSGQRAAFAASRGLLQVFLRAGRVSGNDFDSRWPGA